MLIENPDVSRTENLPYLINSKFHFALNQYKAGTVLKTTNGGNNWIIQTSGTSYYLHSVYFPNSDTGWVVGSYGTIIKTTDSGNNWLLQSSGTTHFFRSVYFINSSTGWAVGEAGTVLATTNGGNNWIFQNSGTITDLISVYFTGSGTGWAAGSGGTILKTTNGGNSWIFSNNINIWGWLGAIYFTDSNTGWAVGYGGTIIKTTNGGLTFVDGKTNEKPTGYNLTQNYPNPFNPNTKIQYSVPQLSQVQIKVFDVLGNEIATLISEKKQAGAYELTWNAVDLPSGVYFYQIRAGDFIQTKKMILLK
jgi:photosystem II stability/assembly factor-like uncharacterized protein